MLAFALLGLAIVALAAVAIGIVALLVPDALPDRGSHVIRTRGLSDGFDPPSAALDRPAAPAQPQRKDAP